MFTFINITLGLILSVLTFIIIVKKILIGIKGIDSGMIFLVVIALGLVGMLCSLFAVLGASSIHELMANVIKEKSRNIETIGIDQFIAKEKTINIIYIVVGYTALIFDFIIYKIMKKKYKQEQAKAKNHLEWNKLS